MTKDQEFFEAARDGNLILVEKCVNQAFKKTAPLTSLRRGNLVNEQDANGYTALHHAAFHGHADVVKLLLLHETSLNIQDCNGISALHLAALSGHYDIIKLLLNHSNNSANPNLQTIEKETPLHFAAQYDQVDALKILLAHGADPFVNNCRKYTPLDLAAQHGNPHIVKILIQTFPEILSPFRRKKIYKYSGNNTVNNILTRACCNFNGFVDSSDKISSRKSYIPSVNKKTIKCHVKDSNYRRDTLLNLNTHYQTPLHLASRNGHCNIVEILLEAGVDINVLTSFGTALHEAALYGKENAVKTLLESGIDLDLTDCERRTALDILNEFPPHITKTMITLIEKYRMKKIEHYEEEKMKNIEIKNRFYNSKKITNLNIIDSNSASPALSNSDFNLKSAAPKKPPRRNLMKSPTFSSPSAENTKKRNNINICLESQNLSFDLTSFKKSMCTSKEENLESKNKVSCTCRSNLTESNVNAIISSANILPIKFYNPNRKLKRNRDYFESFDIDFNKEQSYFESLQESPVSPTNYQQPPTPEHAPPSASQAENFIHERIHPLNQEYKRKSAVKNQLKTDSATSTSNDFLCLLYNISTQSISSKSTISDNSNIRNSVEESLGVPFFVYLQGSIIEMNYINNKYPIYCVENSTVENKKKNQIDILDHFEKNISNYHINDVGNKPDVIARDQEPSKDIICFFNEICNNENKHINKPIKSIDSVEKDLKISNNKSWSLIAEIMKTYGKECFSDKKIYQCDTGEQHENKDTPAEIPKILNCDQKELHKILENSSLFYLKKKLNQNGFKDADLTKEVMETNDLLLPDIPINDHEHFFKIIKTLPIFEKHNRFNKICNKNLVSKVEQWLKNFDFSLYGEQFRKDFYSNMQGVCQIKEVELTTSLEKSVQGHIKKNLGLLSNEANQTSKQTTSAEKPKNLFNRKNRPGPQPPTNLIKIRSPAELLLGLPRNFITQWRHPSSVLIHKYITYDVLYLGSIILQDIQGKEAISKFRMTLKNDNKVTLDINDKIVLENDHHCEKKIIELKLELSECENGNNFEQQEKNTIKSPIKLRISCRGVEFNDVRTDKIICAHGVKTINCAYQDANELTSFAYFTKENQSFNCHLFNVPSMDLATEIILTLGQAFEIAYQLSLRDTKDS